MSNIFLKKKHKTIDNINKLKTNVLAKNKNNTNVLGEIKHFLPAEKEWSSSIYTYNNNYKKLLPVYSNLLTKLLKSYLNFFSKKDMKLYDKRFRTIRKRFVSRRMRVKNKMWSTKKIYLSRILLKHTNSNIVIMSNLYNAQKIYINKILNRLNRSNSLIRCKKDLFIKKNRSLFLKSKMYYYLTKYYENISNYRAEHYLKLYFNTHKKIKLNVRSQNKLYIKKTRLERNKKKIILLKLFIVKYITYLLARYIPLENMKYQDIYLRINKKIFNYCYVAFKHYRLFVKKLFRKKIKTNYFERLLSINNNKFNNDHLHGLSGLINNIYEKKVEFNLVDLKYHYLDSDIFADVIKEKICKTRFPAKIFRLALKNINASYSHKLRTYNPSKSYKNLLYSITNNFRLNTFMSLNNTKKDTLDKILKTIYLQKESFITNYILKNLKNKSLQGIKLQSVGKLSKRPTSTRSVGKIKLKGSLKDLDSSYKGLSSVMLRGNAKSNTQFTKLNSKTRIGAYGLKVWISNK